MYGAQNVKKDIFIILVIGLLFQLYRSTIGRSTNGDSIVQYSNAMSVILILISLMSLYHGPPQLMQPMYLIDYTEAFCLLPFLPLEAINPDLISQCLLRHKKSLLSSVFPF